MSTNHKALTYSLWLSKKLERSCFRTQNKKNQSTIIDEYIFKFPKDVRDVLEELRRVIKKTAPKAEETIRYGIPTFTLNGNLVHFAAFKNHIGFYPTPSAIEAFKKELSPFKQSKGTQSSFH